MYVREYICRLVKIAGEAIQSSKRAMGIVDFVTEFLSQNVCMCGLVVMPRPLPNQIQNTLIDTWPEIVH